ncbi:MAG: hypothetical protein JWQ09_954, partial [Segetibacter sp.]|nr:hypothetical protein [Segetibacter sp.]
IQKKETFEGLFVQESSSDSYRNEQPSAAADMNPTSKKVSMCINEL